MGTPKIHNVSKLHLQEFGNLIKTAHEGDTLHITTDELTEYKHGTISNVVNTDDDYYVLEVDLHCGETAQVYANWRDIPPSATDQDTPFLGFISPVTTSKNSQITDISVN